MVHLKHVFSEGSKEGGFTHTHTHIHLYMEYTNEKIFMEIHSEFINICSKYTLAIIIKNKASHIPTLLFVCVSGA